MTENEREQTITEYRAEQRNRIRDRVEAARANREQLAEAAKTDPEAKQALLAALERQREYHRRQLGIVEQRIAALTK